MALIIQSRIESTISPDVLDDLPSAGSSLRATQRSEKRIPEANYHIQIHHKHPTREKFPRFQRGTLSPTGSRHVVLRPSFDGKWDDAATHNKAFHGPQTLQQYI